MQRAAGVELAATCHICLKTKFADGVGHSCHYCRVRCCARCGGKVTLRSNKVHIFQIILQKLNRYFQSMNNSQTLTGYLGMHTMP